jgi:hypothetical protein
MPGFISEMWPGNLAIPAFLPPPVTWIVLRTIGERASDGPEWIRCYNRQPHNNLLYEDDEELAEEDLRSPI